MIVFPNCKINLGLHITRKRADGYHDLETIFFPLQVNDALEFIPSSEFSFQTTGLSIHGNQEENICIKTYTLLKNRFPLLPPVSLHLHKAIPMGAGLGGGSSDAAFLLKAMNSYFELGLSTDDMIKISLELGSDCPFFIVNKPCYAIGRGEILEPIDLDLSGYHIVLVYPGMEIKTAAAFEGIIPHPSPVSIREQIKMPITSWKERIVNDFEKSVFGKFPEIQNIRNGLYAAGALYASMTGSGSTCYGIFKKLPELDFPEKYRVFKVRVK